jgi:HD-GYP domain-containing protein (c-di-GMP phosphodiesterase class II)
MEDAVEVLRAAMGGSAVAQHGLPADTRPRPRNIVERAIDVAREFLGMEVSYVADTREGLQDYVAVAGDNESFGVSIGEPVDLAGTYCEAMLDGELSNVVEDSQGDARVRDLPITAAGRIGSYIGVPVLFGNGTVYGTFCALSHHPSPGLGERDVRLMRALAALIGAVIEHVDAESEQRRMAVAAGNVAALVAALEARDGYTEQHSRAVVELSLAIGGRLGLGAGELAEVESAALLHDIGKIGISDAVLRKPGPLDDADWAEMRRHPEIGERIVASMPGLAGLAPIIRAEHERWDGAGYPDGLARDAIPLASRIVLAADAYHAITSDRPYRPAQTREFALAELRRNAGKQFCPATVEALLSVLGEGAQADRTPLPFMPEAASLTALAREQDKLADVHEELAARADRQGKPARAAITRRKASEYRAQAREARTQATDQRDRLQADD